MQTFLDALKIAPTSSQVKVNTFLASFNPNANIVSIFIEGKNDPSFFRININRINGIEELIVDTIILGCKEDVLNAWEFLGNRFPNNSRLLFFVDKDHDDLKGSSKGVQTIGNLFVTKFYSIENYLVTEASIRAILIDIWGLDSTSGVIEPACQSFQEFQDLYRTIFLPWMAWHIAAQRLGKKPKIKKIPISILEIDAQKRPRLMWQPDMASYLAQKCKVSEPISPSEIQRVEEILEGLPTKIWLRGKQEIWCMIIFLNELVRLVDEDDEITFSIKQKINTGNAVELLSPRLSCPTDLKDFLTSRLQPLLNSASI
jgi:hypothetical protein